jgi:signal peptidase I
MSLISDFVGWFIGNFPLLLLCFTVFSGLVCLFDWIYVRYDRKRFYRHEEDKLPWVIDYSRAFFPVFLLVFLLRAFVAQPYRVPTGSLEPTVMPGDMVLVTQYPYGLKFPVWNHTLIKVGKPQRGQTAIFAYPVNPKITFYKRVLGLPGDRISYINKVFFINGKEMKQTFVKNTFDEEPGKNIPAKEYQENLFGVKHNIILNPKQPSHDFYNLVVPKGEYFMIGDNRDESEDSRYWGFVPEKDFIGQGKMVLLSWDSKASWKHKIRWHRSGTWL